MDALKYGSHINSEDLQRRFEEIQTLLAQAYRKNQELQKQIDTQELAIQALTNSVNNAAASAGAFLSSQSFNFSGAADRVAHAVFAEGAAAGSNVYIDENSGLLMLNPVNIIDRIPKVLDGSQWSLSDLASIDLTASRKTLNDPTVKWILEPDRFWCSAFDSNELTIRINIPPTLTSEVNFIAIDSLFPTDITHQISWFDIHGNEQQLQPHHRSWAYSIDGRYFGGRISIKLTSSLTVNGKYVFGLRGVRIEKRQYASTGYVISEVQLNHTAGNKLDLRSFKASYTLPVQPHHVSEILQFQIGTTFNGSDIGNIVYDSSTQPFPFKTTDSPVSIIAAPDKLYVKTILQENNGSPMVEGFYLEYNSL